MTTLRRRELFERPGIAGLGLALFAGYTPRVAAASMTSGVMPPPNGVDDAALQAALSANGEVRFDAYPQQPYILANVMVPSRTRITA